MSCPTCAGEAGGDAASARDVESDGSTAPIQSVNGASSASSDSRLSGSKNTMPPPLAAAESACASAVSADPERCASRFLGAIDAARDIAFDRDTRMGIHSSSESSDTNEPLVSAGGTSLSITVVLRAPVPVRTVETAGYDTLRCTAASTAAASAGLPPYATSGAAP